MKLYTPYVVTVGLTEGRKVVAVASFDKEQAEIGVELLKRSESDRREIGRKLLDCISSMKREGPLGKRTIAVTKKTQSGLITSHPVSLYWRVAYLLAKALLANNPEGLNSLRVHLDRVARGVEPNNTIVKPFLYSEGLVPKSTPT